MKPFKEKTTCLSIILTLDTTIRGTSYYTLSVLLLPSYLRPKHGYRWYVCMFPLSALERLQAFVSDLRGVRCGVGFKRCVDGLRMERAVK